MQLEHLGMLKGEANVMIKVIKYRRGSKSPATLNSSLQGNGSHDFQAAYVW